MSRIKPLPIAELSEEARSDLSYAEDLMGFVPNDALTMARWPELLAAVKNLVAVVYKPGALDGSLKRMIATIVSGASGCRYCQAHTALGAVKLGGADKAKIAAVWEFESNPLFGPAERAALNLALAAGQQPNAATDEHFQTLEAHFSQQEIMEIMGVIGLFGFLNSWNDTVATELEDAPLGFAEDIYDDNVWRPGKHAGR